MSRDAHFLLGLQKAGVQFVAADMPEANEMVVGIMAVVAQAERKMISARTKAAPQAAKARGVKLGGLRRRQDGSIVKLDLAAIATGRAARIAKSAARATDIAPIIADQKSSEGNCRGLERSRHTDRKLGQRNDDRRHCRLCCGSGSVSR